MKRTFLLLWLLSTWSLLSSGQMIGSCPERPARSPQDVKELRGVVVDENSAVIPKVKVTLRAPEGQGFHDIGSVETDQVGQFIFEKQRPGSYQLVFSGRGFYHATIPIKYSTKGLTGIRVTLPIAVSDTCSDYFENKLKVEQMTGREGRE